VIVVKWRLLSAVVALGVTAALCGIWAFRTWTGRARLPIGAVVIVDSAAPGELDAALAAVPSALDGVATLRVFAASFDDEQLTQLGVDLNELVDREIARKNPLYVDLEEDEPDLGKLGRYLPMATAAQYLAAGRWASADGRIGVVPVRSCDGLNGESPPKGTRTRCVELDDLADDPLAARVRFLAWPLANAVVVFGKDAQTSASACRALRNELLTPNSSFGLVLCAPGAEAPEELRRALTRLERHRKLFERYDPRVARLLEDSGAAATLELPSEAVIVMPRLSALARRDAFLAAIRRATEREAVTLYDTGSRG
jgi:hypothetical protein